MKKKLLFSGPVLTASGYGVHARQLLRALAVSDEFDIYVESLRWGDTGFLTDQTFDWIRQLVSKQKPQSVDICIQVSIPNEFKRRAPLMIGVTAGIETDRVSPQWLVKCNAEVDLVVVPSEHSRKSFMVAYTTDKGEQLSLQKPIFVMPEGVDTDVYNITNPWSAGSPLLSEVPHGTKNLVFVGLGLDKPEGRDRKNITRLIEWFCRTFKDTPNVGLILKTAIVNSSNLDFEITSKRINDIKSSVCGSGGPPIYLIHGRVSEIELHRIYTDDRVVGMVSLTHGEGFGLPLIEAAACGLPIIATDWSGHVDFLTKDGRKLFIPVDYDLKELHPESTWPGVLEPGSRWAEPRESDACMKMQKLFLDSTTPREWATELAAHIVERYSLDATGKPFVELVRQAAAEIDQMRPPSREVFIERMRAGVKSKGPSLIYTMPMSAGDVFLSTGVVSALRRKHPGHRVYFATSNQYMDILKGSGYGQVSLVDEVIEWQSWMQDVSMLEDIFDEVYTPNMAVQMTHSNWVHRGNGRNLIDEFAAQCNVIADEPYTGLLLKLGREGTWVAVHSGGQKSARSYAHWRDIVSNLRSNGIKVVQVGAKDDNDVGEVDNDLRGKTDHHQLCTELANCAAFVGIDSYPMHVANVVGTKVVAIFGSSYATSTGPKNFKLPVLIDKVANDEDYVHDNKQLMSEIGRLVPIDTPHRNGCERACYKDTCKVDATNPCINNIKPDKVFKTLMGLVAPDREAKYTPYRPKISGYTHILNPKTHGYPYKQSILSMMDFCDEVVVVDGGSTDGSVEELHKFIEEEVGKGRPGAVNDSCNLNVIVRPWDYEEPGMDGMQKAFGRAMASPDAEFLWQQDADEIVHEDDYKKIIDLCKRFPSDVDVIHLPVIELWGDAETCRTDRHSWKWRLTRNNLRVTHGINVKARLLDPKTGRYYAKKGQSDGCEFIDMVTGEFLPHRGFYTAELEDLRQRDPATYGKVMNEQFNTLPSVWHYSWADLPRKVRNFRDFWDKQWQVLYQTEATPRFPGAVNDFDVEVAAERLRVQGGEHGKAVTFKLTKKQPKVMND